MNKKTKKIAAIIIISVIVISLVMLLYINLTGDKIENSQLEITPEEEISDNQLRETTVKLYYVGENNEMKEELRKIDSKDLVNDPYRTTMEMLLNKSKDEKLKTCIPENVKIKSLTKKGECLMIDLSEQFIENMEENVEIQGLAISQIVNTMTQFTEINAIKISINGSDEVTFKNGNVDFRQYFTNED